MTITCLNECVFTSITMTVSIDGLGSFSSSSLFKSGFYGYIAPCAVEVWKGRNDNDLGPSIQVKMPSLGSILFYATFGLGR